MKTKFSQKLLAPMRKSKIHKNLIINLPPEQFSIHPSFHYCSYKQRKESLLSIIFRFFYVKAHKKRKWKQETRYYLFKTTQLNCSIEYFIKQNCLFLWAAVLLQIPKVSNYILILVTQAKKQKFLSSKQTRKIKVMWYSIHKEIWERKETYFM